jgi:ABC-type spermidine/putrescine transport system permease subunit I
VLCLVLGYVAAYSMWKAGPRARAVLFAAVSFPLLTSVIMRTFAWQIILARDGILNDVLSLARLGNVELLNTRSAVIIGMTQVLLPYAVLPVYTVLSRIDPMLPRSSLSLGASPSLTFRRVIFPLTVPGAAVASLLVFILSLGFYVTPALLGGPSGAMISNLVDLQVNTYLDFRAGAALAFILLLSAVVVVVLSYRVLKVDEILRDTS